MMDITFYLFFVALLVSFAAWCIFLWAIRTGQFRDVEDIKYQVWPSADQPEDGSDGVSPRERASDGEPIESR
jgi:cbb3-type cytochrome oxidase maturation protein